MPWLTWTSHYCKSNFRPFCGVIAFLLMQWFTTFCTVRENFTFISNYQGWQSNNSDIFRLNQICFTTPFVKIWKHESRKLMARKLMSAAWKRVIDLICSYMLNGKKVEWVTGISSFPLYFYPLKIWKWFHSTP